MSSCENYLTEVSNGLMSSVITTDLLPEERGAA